MDRPAFFGEWLRQRREALHLSRRELAERASCSVPAVRKIETGERRPSQQLAEVLAAAIGLAPNDHPTFVRVARGELSLERLPPARAPGPPSLQAAPVPFPVPLTRLIGRESEMAGLALMLADPHCRLLTLTGPGGIGKTRLAIEAAATYGAAQAQTIGFVPLAAVHSPEFIPLTITDTLGLKLWGHADPAAQLLTYLRDKSLLLVLDSFEHLLDEVGVLAVLLDGAPDIKLLVTSRERLDLKAEWTFDLHGLPVPPSDQIETVGADVSSAVTLFVESARRARAGFEPQSGEWPAVARICRLVAGVPLAIELAAAWVRVLSCPEIAAEIERTLASDPNLRFLSTSLRDVPERHRSMRAVIDHSWELLSDEERRALRQLAVFRGGFTREAAEDVADASLGLLSALAGKSLVRRVGDTRYDLHELIRQYAAGRLDAEAPEVESIRERHSLYYLGLLESRDGLLRSRQQKEVLAELAAEIDNLRAAWDWAVAHQDGVRLCRVAGTLLYLFELRTWLVPGEIAFRNAVEVLERRAEAGTPDEAALEVALHLTRACCAFFGMRLGKVEAAYSTLVSSAAHLRTSPDPLTSILALCVLGIACWTKGRFAEATESLQEALTRSRALGDLWYTAFAGDRIGVVAHDQGDYARARRYLAEALVSCRSLGDTMLTAHVLHDLGRTVFAQGEYTEAEPLLQESLVLAREIDYPMVVGIALDVLGLVARAKGDYTSAGDLFAEAYGPLKDMGDPRLTARVLNHQGLNWLSLGDVPGAKESLLAALRLAHESGASPLALDALAGLAAVCAETDAREHALELVYLVLEQPHCMQDTKDLATQVGEQLQSRLPPEQIEAAQQRARSQGFDETVRQVLATV